MLNACYAVKRTERFGTVSKHFVCGSKNWPAYTGMNSHDASGPFMQKSIFTIHRLLTNSLFISSLLCSGHTMAADFSVSSSDITNQQTLSVNQVFNGFGCTGKNLSPQVVWQHAPADSKSFAITLYDPDAPTGSGWWHWVVANIPASAASVPSGAGSDGGKLPAGSVQARNDYAEASFGGACPPVGDKPHRYVLTVWALNTESLPVTAQTSAAMVGYMLNQHQIAKASITATYGR